MISTPKLGADAKPVALITGAARRIGRACAIELAQSGHDLIITYRSSIADAQRLATDCHHAGARVQLERLDLAQLDGLDAWCQRLRDTVPRLSVLVHNASTYDRTDLATLLPQDVLAAYSVNAAAPLLLSRGLLPLLQTATNPSIITLGDIHALGEHGVPRGSGHIAYAMSKAALAEMTRSLARELAPTVRVNMLALGVAVWPESGDEADLAMQRAYLSRVPMQRAGTPEEVARAVRWLATDATYMTGQVLRIDGGRSMT